MKLGELRSGSYALVLLIDEGCDVEVGKRTFHLKRGVYAYVGSALSGISSRLNRHLKAFIGITKKKHWHIDYLLPKSKVLYVIYCRSNERLECTIVKKLKELGFFVIKGFGSSDCKSRCGGHLLYMGEEVDKAVDCIKSTFSALGLEHFLF